MTTQRPFLQNTLRRLLEDSNGGFAAARRFLGAVIVVFSAISIARAVYDAGLPADLLARDSIQDYLLATALLAGEYPYVPVPELAERYLHSTEPVFIRSISPHSPILAVAFMPLALLTPGTALSAWVVISITCCLAAIGIFVRELAIDNQHRRVCFVVACGLAFLSRAGLLDVAFGQVNMPLLLLAALAFRALRRGHEFWAGCFLGSCFAIRFFGAPLLLYFLIARRWRVVAGFAGTVATAAALVTWIAGGDLLRSYFVEALPRATRCWRDSPLNLSFPLALARFGTSFETWCRPGLVTSADYALGAAGAILYVALVLRQALRDGDEDQPFLRLLSASVIIAPIVWQHYFTLLLPSVLYFIRQFLASPPQAGAFALRQAFLLGSLMMFGTYDIFQLVLPPPDESVVVPWSMKIVALGPAFVIGFATLAPYPMSVPEKKAAHGSNNVRRREIAI